MSEEPGKILVVDDNEMNRDMLSRRLGRRGYEVSSAAGGQAALDMVEQQAFDVILLDIMMPGIDGMEVLKRLRETYAAAELPIIMATAKTESEDIVQALKLGANDYVTKPLDFAVVLARVNTQFSLKRAGEELRAAHARMKHDLDAAARVQRTLLPGELPQTEAARFAWRYRPCDELAGDSLNVFRIDDRFVALYVLDVSGHGVPAALLSVTATRSLSPNARQAGLTTVPSDNPEDMSPADVAAKVNSLYPMEDNGGYYFTLLYGILDTETRRLRFTSAGHPGPILSRAGEAPTSFDSPAPPIGMVPYDYEEQVIELASGDRLYMHTDGINEEENPSGERFGRKRLLAAIERCRSMTLDESVESLVEEVVAWHGDEHLADDISVLAVEIT